MSENTNEKMDKLEEMLKESNLIGKQENEDFKSGFVTLIGRPNVGKSTLMNRLIGEKIAIVSRKPQTTRNQIQTVLTEEDFQIVFIDTPGMHVPTTKLGNFMVKSADSALDMVDIIWYLVEPYDRINDDDKRILQKLENTDKPVFLLINKIDTTQHAKLLSVIEAYSKVYNFAEIIPISALKEKNTDDLIETVKKYLQNGPMYYPEDTITNQPERQLVSEIVREKALRLLRDEIPHGVAVEIVAFKKRKNKKFMDIECTLYCERESHKRIVIGNKGEMLRDIGSQARYDIEKLLDMKVHLQLWVKVKNNWRDSDFLLKNFGYHENDNI